MNFFFNFKSLKYVFFFHIKKAKLVYGFKIFFNQVRVRYLGFLINKYKNILIDFFWIKIAFFFLQV